jgi:ABC-type phosphate transport system auxiliary subunit
MRDAVKFLIDRMDTNPEEFLQSRVLNEARHDWIPTINDYKKYFSEEEKQLVQTKLSEINLEHMKKFIAERLLAADQRDIMQEKEELSQASLQEAINKIQAVRQQQLLETETTKFHISQGMYGAMQEYLKERKL